MILIRKRSLDRRPKNSIQTKHGMSLLITKFPNKSSWSKNKEREIWPSFVNTENIMKCILHDNQKVVEKGLHAKEYMQQIFTHRTQF